MEHITSTEQIRVIGGAGADGDDAAAQAHWAELIVTAEREGTPEVVGLVAIGDPCHSGSQVFTDMPGGRYGATVWRDDAPGGRIEELEARGRHLLDGDGRAVRPEPRGEPNALQLRMEPAPQFLAPGVARVVSEAVARRALDATPPTTGAEQ